MIQSKDLFINVKNAPTKDSSEFIDFWKNEKAKCKNGIIIDGVNISGFLYYHLNFFKARIDILNEYGKPERKLSSPTLRDNEWIIDHYIQKAVLDKKGLLILGSRRLAKSYIESSYITYNSLFYEGSQNVIVGLNEADIKVITSLCNESLVNLPDAFRIPRPENDWRKQVTFGRKNMSGELEPYSSIVIRNLDGGLNTEALAGLSPFTLIIDEVGKGDFLDALVAAIPSFATPYGWRCSPILTGTSGNLEKVNDARKLFENPEAYNFLAIELEENHNKKRSLFLSGHYAHDFQKDDKSLREYLNLEKGKSTENLEKINIQVTNFERAEEGIDKEREDARKASDLNALRKLTMYHPKNIDELFLSDNGNNFPLEAIEAYQQWLKENYEPEYIEFTHQNNLEVDFKFSQLKPIDVFPVKPETFKEAPVVIYERPLPKAPNLAYVMGIDSYNKNESSDRVNSLGVIYVFKRTINPLGDFQHSIVASYAGRPAEITTFYKIAMSLAEFYNCKGTMLPETNERFSDYFVNRKKGYYIHDSVKLARDISPLFKGKSELGLSPTTRNQRYYMELMVQYAIEEIEIGGESAATVLGVTRIKDFMLLEEMKQYKSKSSSSRGIHDGNFDRIVAFGHALVMAEHLDKNIPLKIENQSDEKDEEKNTKRNKKEIKSFFGTIHKESKSIFNKETTRKRPKGFNFI